MKRLEIGCGHVATPGWLRMDANPEIPDLDHCGLAQERLPWADGELDEIRAVDVLEHISYRETHKALVEWARVLRKGGQLYVQVPEARAAILRFLNDPGSLVTKEFENDPPITSLAWRLLGGQNDGDYTQPGSDWRWNAHCALFDTDSLTWHLTQAGFRVTKMQVNPFPNILCWAVRA